jgi:hypothetical protein
MTAETHIKGLIHNGRRWDVIRIKDSYFARCYGQGETAGRPSDTGPYSTALQAEEFITAVRRCPQDNAND